MKNKEFVSKSLFYFDKFFLQKNKGQVKFDWMKIIINFFVSFSFGIVIEFVVGNEISEIIQEIVELEN